MMLFVGCTNFIGNIALLTPASAPSGAMMHEQKNGFKLSTARYFPYLQ